MALRREITTRIIDLLQQNPQGLSITEIVKHGGINRNTAGRYLDNLLVTGQVEMRHFGMAKIYTLSRRLPVSSVLSISSELVMQLDAGLRIIYLNQPFIGLIGATEKDLTGKNIEFSRVAVYFDDTFPTILEWISSGLSGTEFRGEIAVPVRKKIFACRVAPTVFNNGQKGVSILFDDITLQKQGERLLRESEGRLRSIIRVAPIGIGLVVDRTFLEVNDRVCQMTGYTEDELVGKSVRMIYPTQEEYDRVGVVKYREMDRTGTGSLETVWLRKDGTIIGVLLSSTLLDPDHPEAGITFTALDITERQRADRALRESEEKFRILFNSADDMMTLNLLGEDRLHGHYIEVNDVTCRKLQYTREELLKKAPEDLVARESLPYTEECARRLLADGHATFEAALVSKDHREIPVEISAHLFDFKGQLVALAIIRDITARRKAEEQLRLMKISIDSAYDEIFWMDMQADFLYVNDAACRITGYSREELYAMKVFTLDPDFTPARWEESIADLRKNKKQFFRTRHRRKDGVILDVEISSVYVTRGEEEYVFCFVRDITERNRIEAALCENEARYRSLAEVSQDIIFLIDRDDQVLYVNQTAADFLGRPAREIIGRPRDANFPEDVSRRQFGALQHVFATGQPLRNEGPMNMRGGVRWYDHALVPIPGETGEVASVLGVSRDITRRIAAEQERQQNEQASRFIAGHCVDIIHRLTPDCVCTYTSPSITTLLGYAEAEVLGKHVLGMIHPDDLPRVLTDIARIRDSGEGTVTSTFRFRHRDGHYLLFESTTRIVRDAAGNVKEFLSISRDISTRSATSP